MPLLNFISSGIVVFLLSYMVGSIPCGFLIGKFNGLDIRHHGSHNIGATNVRRTLGKDWGLICFVLDFLKGLLPVVLIGHGLAANWQVGFGWGGIIAAIGTVIGHVFPCWLNFHGGKGVATSLGAVLGVAFWPVVIGALIWLAAFFTVRIVSIASMAAAVGMAISSLIMLLAGTSGMHWSIPLLLFAIAALIVIRHKENITRLREGRENTFVKIKPRK
ncbi:MAG TPA: glycerol-3-phosphate 1-O-acyltransferase PlsY [Lentisphaeria bacterium]|nr:glycerol-3-phosphate 1-O-acyltransferase PlsY [Lentisphaeria bacterium]